MPDRLGLLCHVQRIAPRSQLPLAGGATWQFSLTLATSTIEGQPADIYFQPWHWASFAAHPPAIEFQLEKCDADGSHRTLVARAPGTWVLPGVNCLPVGLTTLLDALDHEVTGGGWDRVWQPAPAGESIANRRLLRNLHARLATLPFPIAQSLQLSLQFTCDLDAPTCDAIRALLPTEKLLIFAVPGVRIGGEQHLPTALAGLVPTVPSAESVFQWQLESPGAAASLMAYLQPDEYPRPTGSITAGNGAGEQSLLDLEQLWARSEIGGGWYDGDWTQTIVPKTAAAFDLPAELLLYARLQTGTGQEFEHPTPDKVAALVATVLALLRDQAGAGLHPAPAGGALIDVAIHNTPVALPTVPASTGAIAAQLQALLRRGLQESFRAAVQRAEHAVTLDNWWTLATATLPQLADLDLLPANPQSLPPFADVLAFLDRARANVANSDNAARLVLAEWQAAVARQPSWHSAGVFFDPLANLPGDLAPGSAFLTPGGGPFADTFLQADGAVAAGAAALHPQPLPAEQALLLLAAVRVDEAHCAAPYAVELNWSFGHLDAATLAGLAGRTSLARFSSQADETPGTAGNWQLVPAMVQTPATVAGPPPEISLGLSFSHTAGASLAAAWDDVVLAPLANFFTEFDPRGDERGALDLADGQQWIVTLPQVDHSIFHAADSNRWLLYWFGLFGGSVREQNKRPDYSVTAVNESAGTLGFLIQCGGQSQTASTGQPLATLGEIDLRLALSPQISAPTVQLQWRTAGGAWANLGIPTALPPAALRWLHQSSLGVALCAQSAAPVDWHLTHPTVLGFPVGTEDGLLQVWDSAAADNQDKPALFLRWANQRPADAAPGDRVTLGERMLGTRVHDVLVESNLAPLLPTLLSPADPATHLPWSFGQRMQHAVVAYFQSRVRDAGAPAWHTTWMPAGSATWLATPLVFQAQLAALAERMAAVIQPQKPAVWDPTLFNEPPGGQTSATPQALAVPFDRLGTADEELDADAGMDLHRRLAGLAVLLGVHPGADNQVTLRALNMAQVVVEYGGHVDTLVASALVPYRPSYSAGQRQTLITYDNRSLVVNRRDNPFSQYDLQPTAAGGAGPGFRIVYKPVQGVNPWPDWDKMPPLRFGTNYVAATALIDPGGALPGLLTLPGAHAAQLAPHTAPPAMPPMPQVGGALDPTYVQRIRYLRRVPVSTPRLERRPDPPAGSSADKTTVELPPVPASAHPLARELARERVAAAVDTDYWFAGAAQLDFNQPLLLELDDVSFLALDGPRQFTLELIDAAENWDGGAAARLVRLQCEHRQVGNRIEVRLTSPDAAGFHWTTGPLARATYDLSLQSNAAGNQLTAQWRGTAYDPLRPLTVTGVAPSLAAAAVAGLWLRLHAGGASGCLALSRPTVRGVDVGGHELVLEAQPRTVAPAGAGAEELPLVLLSPQGWNTPQAYQHVQLAFGRPATSLETWSRWFHDADSPVANLRRDVWADVYRRRDAAYDQQLADPEVPRTVTTDNDDWLDDPATADDLLVELIPIRVDRLPAEPLRGYVKVGAAVGAVGLEQVRNRAVPINCHHLSDPRQQQPVLSMAADRSSADVYVRPGEIWELRVYGCVETHWFAAAGGRFSPLIEASAQPAPASPSGLNYLRFAPARYVLEGASDLASTRVLWIGPTNGPPHSLFRGWMQALGFADGAKFSQVATPAQLGQFDLDLFDAILVLPGTAAGLAPQADLLVDLSVPLVVLGRDEAVALGLGTAGAANPANALQFAAPAGEEWEMLSAGFSAGETTNWQAAALLDATATGVAFVPGDPHSLLIYAYDTDLRPGRRAVCPLPNGWETAPLSNIVCRLFQASVRWAARWPLADRLARALRPIWDGAHASLTLERRESRSFDMLADMEVRRQDWRWQGRPTSRFPFEIARSGAIDRVEADTGEGDAQDLAACPVTWDVEGFANRSDDDHVRRVTTTTPRPLALASPLEDDDLSRDLRAMYRRYTLVAHSRYAGLAPVSRFAAARYVDPAQLDLQHLDRWRRLFVPCRLVPPVPKPAIKLVFPLTESDASRGDCPGVVVVMNDAWFGIGGLCETVRCEIELVTPQVAKDGVDYRLTFGEAGPDPILSLAEYDPTQGGTLPAGTPPATPPPPPLFEVAGPIGTTFDKHSPEALYTKSWFVVEPYLAGGVAVDGRLDWHLAKLRFRRELLPQGVETPSPAPVDCRPLSALDVATEAIALANTNVHTFELRRAAAPAAVIATANVQLVDGPNGRELVVGRSGSLAPAVKLPWDGDTQDAMRLRWELRGLGNLEPAGTVNCTNWSVGLYACTARSAWRRIDLWYWADPDAGQPLLPVVTQAGGGATAHTVLPVVESPPTAPHWIQFLPDADRLSCRVENQGPAMLGTRELRVVAVPGSNAQGGGPASADGIRLLKRVAGEPAVALEPVQAPQSFNGFVQVVALTQVVSDVRGVRAAERFLGLFGNVDGAQPFDLLPVPLGPATDPIPPLPVDANLRARVLTLQLRLDELLPGGQVLPDDLRRLAWSRLFGGADPSRAQEDETVRVVGVSPPIESAACQAAGLARDDAWRWDSLVGAAE